MLTLQVQGQRHKQHPVGPGPAVRVAVRHGAPLHAPPRPARAHALLVVGRHELPAHDRPAPRRPRGQLSCLAVVNRFPAKRFRRGNGLGHSSWLQAWPQLWLAWRSSWSQSWWLSRSRSRSQARVGLGCFSSRAWLQGCRYWGMLVAVPRWWGAVLRATAPSFPACCRPWGPLHGTAPVILGGRGSAGPQGAQRLIRVPFAGPNRLATPGSRSSSRCAGQIPQSFDFLSIPCRFLVDSLPTPCRFPVGSCRCP